MVSTSGAGSGEVGSRRRGWNGLVSKMFGRKLCLLKSTKARVPLWVMGRFCGERYVCVEVHV